MAESLLQKFRKAVGGARTATLERYRQLLQAGSESGSDKDVEALREAMQALGKAPEEIERDAAVLLEAKRLEVEAATVDQAKAAFEKAMGAGFAWDQKLRQEIQRLTNLLTLPNPEANALKVATEQAKSKWDQAEYAAKRLAELRQQHPELFA